LIEIVPPGSSSVILVEISEEGDTIRGRGIASIVLTHLRSNFSKVDWHMWNIIARTQKDRFRLLLLVVRKEARRDSFPFFGSIAEFVSGLRRRGRGAGAGRRDAPDYVFFQRLDGPWRGALSDALRKGNCLIEGGKGTIPEGGGLRVFHSNALLEPLWRDSGNGVGSIRKGGGGADEMHLTPLRLSFPLAFATRTAFSFLLLARR
jgi:hypothetical protein